MKNYPVGTKFYHEGVLKYTLVELRNMGGRFKAADGIRVTYYGFEDSLYYELHGKEYGSRKYYDVAIPKSIVFNSLYNKLRA